MTRILVDGSKKRDQESHCFSTPCLRAGHNILSPDAKWNGVFLDGGGFPVVHSLRVGEICMKPRWDSGRQGIEIVQGRDTITIGWATPSDLDLAVLLEVNTSSSLTPKKFLK